MSTVIRGRRVIGESGEYYHQKGRLAPITRYAELGIDILDTSFSRPWTPDGEETLLELWDMRHSAEEIAGELKRTLPDVLSRLTKVAYEELSPEELAWYGKLRREG